MRHITRISIMIACGLCFYGCDDDSEMIINAGNTDHSTTTRPDDNPQDPQDVHDDQQDPHDVHDDQQDPQDVHDDQQDPQDDKKCNCDQDEQCIDGACVRKCEIGSELCGENCLDFNLLHLESCDTCSVGYCDTDANLANGCEASTQNDVNHCGSCGHVCNAGENCTEGVCTPICQESELYCNGNCLIAADLHLASCDACAENYCDTDNNLANGCEAYALADDVNNCGACGLTCNEGESCVLGSCKKPYRVMLMKNGGIYSEASASGGGVGSKYDYVYVFEELDGWYHVTLNGNEGWVAKDDTLYACDECEGRKAIDMAEKMLYNSDTHMCTFDHYNANTVPEFTEKFVSLAGHSSCNYGYDLNCANFVTAILRANGLMNSSAYTFVDDVYAHCTSGKDGYRVIDKSQAKPGDFWVTNTMSHAELVVGYYNGALLLIGSNNFDKSTSLTNMCLETALTNGKYSSAANDYQRVSYGGEYMWGYVCSRQ